MTTRREFITNASLVTFGSSAIFTPGDPQLVHHVFFWLKNKGSEEDRKKLIEGLKSLRKIETVRSLHIGIPADTEEREVVDNSYDVSELIFFDNVEDQNIYQTHPIHVKFVDECSSLWSKVVVYDAVSIS